MKIIGAGFPRTGTMSLQAALQRLGYPCYHMREVARRPAHIKAWRNYVTGQPMDWETVFAGFEATADMQGCFYFEELMHQYPAAKATWRRRTRNASSLLTTRTSFVLCPRTAC